MKPALRARRVSGAVGPRAADCVGTQARIAIIAGPRYGRTAHLRLVRRRHALLLAAVDDSPWRPWRRWRRRRELAAVEAALDLTGLPW